MGWLGAIGERARTRDAVLRVAFLALAFAHTFPARRHLGLFFHQPSLSEAWKGFGAVLAVTFFLSPRAWRSTLLAKLRRPHDLVWVVALLLTIAHLVPTLDHAPRALRSFSWGDGWRGLGAVFATLWFARVFFFTRSSPCRCGRHHDGTDSNSDTEVRSSCAHPFSS